MTRHRADLLGPEQTALKYFLTSSEGERVCVSDSECVEYKTRRRDEMQQRQTEKDKVDGQRERERERGGVDGGGQGDKLIMDERT